MPNDLPNKPRRTWRIQILMISTLSMMGFFAWIFYLQDSASAATLAPSAQTVSTIINPTPSPIVATPTPTPIPTETPVATPTPTPAPTPTASPSPPAPSWLSQVNPQLTAIVAKYPNDKLGLEVINLTTNETATNNADQVFYAGSTTKMLTATYFLHQVETGKYSPTGSLNGETAGAELKQLINQSDNDAWDAFNNLLGLDNQQQYAQSLGLKTYDVHKNAWSAGDYASLLSQLYKGKLLNPANTKMLLSYMQNTNSEQYLSSALLAGYQIYHKVGYIDGDVHDGGVIANGTQTYVIVVFTNSTDDATSRIPIFQDVMHAIAK